MTRTILFLVTGDPRTSPRPAEAIRIAAGVDAWRRAEVAVYLRGPAVQMLGEWPEDLVDGDNFVRYLPMLGERDRPLYLQKDALRLAGMDAPRLKVAELDDRQLAELAIRSDCLLRF